MAAEMLRGRDLLSMDDLSREELQAVLARAADLKARLRAGEQPPVAAGKTLAMIFEKPSLRTRVTFEVGMRQLGGQAVYLAPQDIQLGTRESVPDVARNLSRWVEAIMARTYAHRTVQELADHASVPVINGLSDREHPCQTLGDLLTIQEHFGRLEGIRLTWVGDGNNVLHSLLLGGAKVGLRITVSTPPAYEPAGEVVARARAIGGEGAVVLMPDPYEAVRGADVIYTDVWVSMGQEAEREQRLRAFAGYRVDGALLRAAGGPVRVMHCLPAHRGEEITAEVLDGPQAIVLDQAENRLHAQKGLLAMIL
ncbi:MAG: ornithine carbamoyltransferase [Armatimonadota bacterium]|nr:ornithine carbamoyltransferase [Armatimonadota bacterium]MDR7451988.1 ornithine carbamoyltransferase [Armatimonadota bacterium]MDR7467879.1 ornithine carbamoyltransferase [Armatimonadota bacterium]MDR7494268.1 ornithine carbamoyltransferase [Armatimonadota bacterium]MDR7500049.1 ornithine carbamoyltransferase [Armatimonadota bacterium]